MSIKIIDTHCHLNMAEFDKDREEIIKNSVENGVEFIIMPSTELKDFNEEQTLCKKYSVLRYLVGIHPHEAKECSNSDYDAAYEHLKDENCKGIGEIGLDYYYEHSEKKTQKEVFNNFLDIAIEKNVPVSIHSRESTEDMIDILKTKKGLKGVIHCFSGEEKLLKTGLDMGLYFGIGGVLTFKKSLLRQNINIVPIERIVFETDAPYLAPHPKRGKRNEPLYINYVIEEMSSLTKQSKDILAKSAFKNSMEIFSL